MAGTGYDWDAAWTVDAAATVLTTGGTIVYTSASAISTDSKAACEVSIDADYSDHAKATGGLFVYILKDINATAYEGILDLPWGFEMPWTINATNRRSFSVDCSKVNSFKIYLWRKNTTASSVATVATSYIFATVPVAS